MLQLGELVYESNKYRKDVINLKGFIVSLPFKLNHTSCLTKRLNTQHHFEAENINLQVGNPETDDYYDSKGIVEYAWSHAVISDQLYRHVNQICNFKLPIWPPECSHAMSSVFGQLQQIDIYNIYAPTCPLKKTISPTYRKACLRSGNNFNLCFFIHLRYTYPVFTRIILISECKEQSEEDCDSTRWI